MNRELKFRVWDKQDKSFLSEEYLKHFKVAISWDGKSVYQNFICGDKKVDDEVIIQQYTGLKDKNGKEIYEGDILKYQSNDPKFSTCIVRWTQEDEDNHPGFVISNNYSQYGKPEIIGNIMENPELIKTNE